MNIESKIKKNIPLAPLTTFKIGGSAKYFIEVKTKDELESALAWSKEKKEIVFILAGGSNILVNDDGVDGLVIKINNQIIKAKGGRIEAGAGAKLAQVVSTAVGNNLAGLEWAAGIPGTIGGAVRGNAGAFGSSMVNIIETVEVFNIKKNKFNLFSNKDCAFKYRHSIFKEQDNLVIWQAVLRLRPGNSAEINGLIKKYLTYREQSQPKLPNAGSIFKNLEIADLREFNTNLADMAKNEGAVKGGKVGAGWIIDKLGIKGKTIGRTKVSLEHANFIINTGEAKAEEVIILISYIKQKVRTKFGVQLHEEIQYVGF